MTAERWAAPEPARAPLGGPAAGPGGRGAPLIMPRWPGWRHLPRESRDTLFLLGVIAWKKAAKAFDTGGELISRDTSASARQELWLDWAACPGLAPEDRLSRLAAWTLAAHRAGADYGLRLPGVEIAPADGDAQRRRSLEALALWR